MTLRANGEGPATTQRERRALRIIGAFALALVVLVLALVLQSVGVPGTAVVAVGALVVMLLIIYLGGFA
jgi:hypothetical protein